MALKCVQGFPGGSVVKNLPANAGDKGLIPGSRRSPGEGNGNSRQYSCLENPMDRGAWWTAVHGVVKRVGHDWATKQQQQNVLKVCSEPRMVHPTSSACDICRSNFEREERRDYGGKARRKWSRLGRPDPNQRCLLWTLMVADSADPLGFVLPRKALRFPWCLFHHPNFVVLALFSQVSAFPQHPDRWLAPLITPWEEVLIADPRETSNPCRAHLHFNCDLKCLNPKGKNKKPAKVRLSGTTRGPGGKLFGARVMSFHGLFKKNQLITGWLASTWVRSQLIPKSFKTESCIIFGSPLGNHGSLLLDLIFQHQQIQMFIPKVFL